VQAQTPLQIDRSLKVILLGTRGGPAIDAQRPGNGTLVIAGREMLLFDCGRDASAAITRMAILPADVTKVFLTHLHSDHVVGLPELYLFPWATQGRSTPLQVWGPDGTKSMMEHLEKAFAFDIHIRRDVDEKFSADGIKVVATDVREGVVYRANGVTVTAFLVDHAPIVPAFGYRIEYQGRSVVLSGDTRVSDNLIKFAKGADLLIHEVGMSKEDPRLAGPLDERVPGARGTRRQLKSIVEHHTDPAEAGIVFEKVKPKLAMFSHYTGGVTATALPLVRQNYSGPLEFGEDGMTIDVGETIAVRRLPNAGR
jgi:ribonuclease Z